jgi:hypothetical protein
LTAFDGHKSLRGIHRVRWVLLLQMCAVLCPAVDMHVILPFLCVSLLQVCAVLCYAQQNNVEPFLEPVLLLAHAMMLHDTQGLARSSGNGQILEVFLTQLLTFADLCSHSDSVVALAAAQCLAQLVSGMIVMRGRGLCGAQDSWTAADIEGGSMTSKGGGSYGYGTVEARQAVGTSQHYTGFCFLSSLAISAHHHKQCCVCSVGLTNLQARYIPSGAEWDATGQILVLSY